MRLAGHTLGTPEQSLPEALSLFRDAGLHAAEVIYQDGYPAALPTGDVEAARRAAAWARRTGVSIVALTPYTTALNSLDPDERRAAVEELRGCLRAAEIVGAQAVRIYGGKWLPGATQRSDHWDSLVSSLQELAGDAVKCGVVLCVENHFGTMTQSAEESARLVRDVGSPAVRILYDQANLTFTHDEPYPLAMALQGGLIGHVHVKDLVFTDPERPFAASETARVKEGERAVQSRVVGQGCLPWSDIIGALYRSGYDGFLSIEYEYRWHRQDLPNPKEGFRMSAANLRAILSSVCA